MKRTFLLLLSTLLPLLASAYDAQIDGIYYNFSGNEATVTYQRIGIYYTSDYSDYVAIPSTVTYNGTTYSVTSIGIGAFYNCSGLTSVTIPGSVTSIGSSAFSGCSGLTSITIPNSVTSIGNHAFAGCSGLTSIKVEIGNDTYDSRNNCNAIIETATNTLITGCQNTVIPNSVTSIGSSAFYNCSSLTSITIPNSVTSIGDYAFRNCSSLTSITIPNSVTSISDYAFYGCSGLTSVTIPEGVTSIGKYAFEDCSGLTSVTIPNSVTSIGYYAFQDCNLRNVLVKCLTIPILDNKDEDQRPNAFSQATCHHATLYVPTGCWDAYAFGAGWFWFNNIRETAMAEEEVSMQQAYTLMDAGTFAYSVYDPVNDRIGTINSAGGINEDNPNHSWQVIEADGWHYLYNIGARKYVRREGDRLELTDTPEPIELADSNNGLILGGQTEKPCVLVSNERMSVAQSAIDVVTGIKNLNNSPMANGQPFFNLAGQRIKTPQHGINIIGNRKVLVK